MKRFSESERILKILSLLVKKHWCDISVFDLEDKMQKLARDSEITFRAEKLFGVTEVEMKKLLRRNNQT